MDAGTSAAARANFELLVGDVLMLDEPTIRPVEGPGGRDWGIDLISGDMGTAARIGDI